ncbi:MAG TPA: Gfo/Idh/MocA family oxidoreductase [Gemmataceae bacterium]|jgi:predicted dehydrogenase|nr:Gfo/Idh/MocA family oxidoreductase [Gemmataceae bacterium]
MNTSDRLSRRSFLKTTATASAGLAAFGVPAVNALGANDQLQIGLIGTGGRCQALMKALAKVPNTRMAAVCDIWDVHLEAGRKLAVPKAFATKHYHEILDRKDIDAVLIASPDHWHVPMTVDACNAGKHVYVEKPLTHNLAEGKAVIDAQNRNGVIVQVGMQQRSMPQFQKARELIRAGRCGDIHKVHLTWNRNTERFRAGRLGIDPKSLDWKAFLGNAPEQPFNDYRFRNWRWFWDFGGGLFTDLMVHYIDVVHWFLDLDHPQKATAVGSYVQAKDVWETPDTVQCLLVYPNDLQVYFEGTFCNARNGAMLEFMGSNATLYLDRGRYEIHPERNRGSYEEWVLGKGKRGQDFYDKPDGELIHLTNWVECVRERKRPTAPAEAGVSAASAAHLANQALRSGQVVAWKD